MKDLPSKKASGRKWEFYAVVDLVVSGNGKIEEVEEWYCREFDAEKLVERDAASTS